MNNKTDLDHRRVFDWDPATDSFEQVAPSHHIDGGPEMLDLRRELLQYLVAEDISGYRYVTTVLRAFMIDPESVIEQVRADRLNFSQLEVIEDGHAI
jgi:hypothetical protein